MPVRSDVTPSDKQYHTALQKLEGVKTWQPNWDEVEVSLSDDISRWQKVTDGE